MENGVIQKRLKILDDLLHEISKLKGDLEDALMDDPNYSKMLERTKKLKRVAKKKRIE